MATTKYNKRTVEDLQQLPIIGSKPRDEKEENFLREICEFEFMNIEESGVSVRFPYGNAQHQHVFTLFHGGKYKLPRFIARHLESCCTPIWEWRPDGSGRMNKSQVGTKPRFQMRQSYGG